MNAQWVLTSQASAKAASEVTGEHNDNRDSRLLENVPTYVKLGRMKGAVERTRYARVHAIMRWTLNRVLTGMPTNAVAAYPSFMALQPGVLELRRRNVRRHVHERQGENAQGTLDWYHDAEALSAAQHSVPAADQRSQADARLLVERLGQVPPTDDDVEHKDDDDDNAGRPEEDFDVVHDAEEDQHDDNAA